MYPELFILILSISICGNIFSSFPTFQRSKFRCDALRASSGRSGLGTTDQLRGRNMFSHSKLVTAMDTLCYIRSKQIYAVYTPIMVRSSKQIRHMFSPLCWATYMLRSVRRTEDWLVTAVGIGIAIMGAGLRRRGLEGRK
ncbi:hypothetical protein FPQ18DRAFT_355365 [Pyronema domesticum]|nr:hypothetical protein FPQ18DRAFT_355365 [Pyronema domesticum]